MACNENIIKNIAQEVTRNCQSQSYVVDTEFIIYLIELLLLNPKYGKMFQKTLKRSNLEYFVKECGLFLTSGKVSIKTLRMQQIMQKCYNNLDIIVEKREDTIKKCLKPLLDEILDEEPDANEEEENKKYFRKIAVYTVLASGLGSPSVIGTLKEAVGALESVLSIGDLKTFVTLPRVEKYEQLKLLVSLVSGVRLFNKDCGKGGDEITDLSSNLLDACQACQVSFSNALVTGMQRVYLLTSAIDNSVQIHPETGNVFVQLPPNSSLAMEEYKKIFDLLAFHRQYEIVLRKLLNDTEVVIKRTLGDLDKVKTILGELHSATNQRSAVPVDVVFPLFEKLWSTWRCLQNEMYLTSTINSLASRLSILYENIKFPYNEVEKMLDDNPVVTDHDRMKARISLEQRLSLGALRNYRTDSDEQKRQIQFLGFCPICLCVGALIPGKASIGTIKYKGNLYAFCNYEMAMQFNKDSERYVNGALQFIRNNPELINLLNVIQDIIAVKDIDTLAVDVVEAIKTFDRDIQTEVHPIESNIDRYYTWDLWKWKRRACQWANIVNCQTHGTQTIHSHLRSEIQCQTVEARDKSMQTMKDVGVNVPRPHKFVWGLRGELRDTQHWLDLTMKVEDKKLKSKPFTICEWPCDNLQKIVNKHKGDDAEEQSELSSLCCRKE